MKYLLIGSQTCPFVQRCLITLMIKKADFDIQFLDLANKPEWFLKLSPTSKVPMLLIDGNVIFESTVINEFLNETLSPNLHPDDGIQRALNRGWIEFSSSLQSTLYAIAIATEENKILQLKHELDEKLSILENTKKQEPYFNGNNFYLIDIAFAPFFLRLQLIDKYYPLKLLINKPTMQQWSNNILNHSIVKKSNTSDYKSLILENFRIKKGIFSNFLPIPLCN